MTNLTQSVSLWWSAEKALCSRSHGGAAGGSLLKSLLSEIDKRERARRPGLPALFWTPVTPYGRFELDMSSRLDLGSRITLPGQRVAEDAPTAGWRPVRRRAAPAVETGGRPSACRALHGDQVLFGRTAVRGTTPLRKEVVRGRNPRRKTEARGKIPTPCHSQRIAHRGACGKTRVVPQNGRPRPEPGETTDSRSARVVDAQVARERRTAGGTRGAAAGTRRGGAGVRAAGPRGAAGRKSISLNEGSRD